MEEKKKGYLELPSYERDYRLLIADKLLTEMSLAQRMDVLQEMFLIVAKNHNDEAACALIDAIGKESYLTERKKAIDNDCHYGNAAARSDKNFCEYLMDIYWALPDKKQSGTQWSDFHFKQMPVYDSTLLKTKSKIIEICFRHWANHYFEMISEENLHIFKFVINAYFGAEMTRYVSKEEKEEILRFLREDTNHNFTPEILEKWLELPNTPEEIKKIFIIARARNGGVELVERDMKNAEILKPLDVENRSEAALEFHKKFCAELKYIEEKVKELTEELQKILLDKADKIEIIYFSLDKITLHVRFRKGDVPYPGFEWYCCVPELGERIRRQFSKYKVGRQVSISFIFWEGNYNWGSYIVPFYF